MLLHSPADVIRALLVALGFSPVYTASEPPLPDTVITTFNTQPRGDGRTMVDGETLRHYGVQTRVRSVSDSATYLLAEEIHAALDTRVKQNIIVIDGSIYLVWSVSGTDVVSLGFEAGSSKRCLCTINSTVSMRRVG